MTLQPIRRTASYIAIRPGELLPHLFTLTGRIRRSFSVTLLHPRGQLPVKKYGALCCPDVPPVLKDERQTGRLQCDKGNSFNRQLKIENRDNHIKMVRYGSLLLFFQSNLFLMMSCICSTLSCIFSVLSYMFSTLSKIDYIGI